MPGGSSSKKTSIVKKNIKKVNEIKINQAPNIPYSDYIKEYQILIYLINPQENIKETNQNFEKE